MLIEPGEEGGFVVTYPDLSGVVGEGENVAEATANAEELRMVWTETCFEDGMKIPLSTSISVPATLDRLKKDKEKSA